MAFQQNFGSPTIHLESEGDASYKQKLTSLSQSPVPENLNGCFDCNICLDSCNDPVVTLCGHLYCWPCIYKWLQVQSSSFETEERPKCPVCKSYISKSSLVPLYGRGTSPSESDLKKPLLDLINIPPRPAALGMNALIANSASISLDSNQQNNPNPQYFAHPFSNYTSITSPTFGSNTTSSFSPTINMVGEIVFAGMFGNSDSNLFAYPYSNSNSNSYPFPGNGSPRLRRQEVQLDKSLNRVSIFLFCCIALCLILF